MSSPSSTLPKEHFSRIYARTTVIPRNFGVLSVPSSQKALIAPLLYPSSTTAITKQTKANLLNQFFTSSFNPSVVQHSYGPSPALGPLPNHLEIIPAEVAILLKEIKPHSASGTDSISVWMLRSFADVASPSIASLFNLSLRLGKLPKDWKLSNMVPTHKGTNTSEVQFYRPVSLLPLISKTLERYVQSFLLEHLLNKLSSLNLPPHLCLAVGILQCTFPKSHPWWPLFFLESSYLWCTPRVHSRSSIVFSVCQ